MNTSVLRKGQELLRANGSMFEQLLFPDDAALGADSEQFCILVSEFGREC